MSKKHDASTQPLPPLTSPDPTTSPLATRAVRVDNPIPFPSNYRTNASPRHSVTLTFEGQGKTHQSFRDECDINRIMGRYAVTGVLDFLNKREAIYADVSEVDFQNAMDTVVAAQAMFSQLPSNLRERFSNDPARLLAFLDDPVNRDEAVRLGLVNAPQAPSAAPDGAAPPAPPSPPSGAV